LRRGNNAPGDWVVVFFEKSPRDCHSEARECGARTLLFRCSRQADSSPIRPASD
jgi:hypothetical protein